MRSVLKQRFLEYPKSSIPKARENRQKQTEAEKTFWNLVRNNKLGIKFKRQVPFGPYILDFYCHTGMLAVELDGNQHYEKEGREYDKKRDEFLSSYGIIVLRFLNSEFLSNQAGVLGFILEKIEERKSKNPHPDPLP